MQRMLCQVFLEEPVLSSWCAVASSLKYVSISTQLFRQM